MPDHTVHSELDEALIFVVGARRSGTHWLQRILSSHPDVTDLPGETHFFSAAIASLMEHFMHGTPASPSIGQVYAERTTLLEATRRFCDALLLPHLRRGPATRLLERTPEHVQVIELIATLYPQAHFVHIIRDGRDSIRSLLHQSFGPDDVREAATEWQASVRAGREQGARVNNYVEVRYEELRANTRAEVARLLDQLGLAGGDQVLDNAVGEAQARVNQPKGPPRPLTGRQLRLVERVAGDTLTEFGYAKDGLSRDASREDSRPPTDPAKQPVETPHQRQRAIDQFLAEVRSPSPSVERLRGLTSSAARFEVVAPDGSSRWVDELQDFVDLLEGDHGLREEIQRAKLHVGSKLTVVLHEAADAVRVFAFRFDNEGIRECSVQQLVG